MSDGLQQVIEAGWDARDGVNAETRGELREAVEIALADLDSGKRRVAEKGADGWTVNQWLKKAVLLSFRLNDMTTIAGGPGGAQWWDKVPSKFRGWGADPLPAAAFRSPPGAVARGPRPPIYSASP